MNDCYVILNEAHKDDDDIVVENINIINDSQKLKTKDNRISGKKCVIKTCNNSNRSCKKKKFLIFLNVIPRCSINGSTN